MKRLLIYLLSFVTMPAYAQAEKRIISVGGGLTEIMYALEAQELLVGNDTTSYYPAAAKKLPKVGYQRMLSAEGILSLRPDLVILTPSAGPPAVLKQLEVAGVPLLRLAAGRSLDDIKDNIIAIGKITRRQEKAGKLIAKIDQEYAELIQRIRKQTRVPRVIFILQYGNGAPMVAGANTEANSIIMLSGAKNVVQDYEGYKPLTPEALVSLQPEVILITNRGLIQAGGKVALLDSPGIALTLAAQNGNLVVMDSLLLLGFGPRTVATALALHQAYQAF